MGNFDDDFINTLRTQSWALYGVGIFFILLRLYARARRLGGVLHWQIDDYLQILVAGLYTTLIVCLNTIAQGGGSNLYPAEMEGTFTPAEIEERIYGSKIVVVSEQAMLNVIYVIKACLLIMYTRLTLGLTTQRFVKYLACYVAIGWLGTEITFFTACRPFSGYWGMPPPNAQCTTLEYYAIVQACFNISSDLLMLGIPLPLIWRLNMAWKQKIVLGFIFSLGSFVIVAALLTKIFNLTNLWDPSYMLWYVREASVAVYVSNLPMIWPLLREWFPWLRALNPASGMPTTSGLRKSRPTNLGKGSQLPTSASSTRKGADDFSPSTAPPGSSRTGSGSADDDAYSLGETYELDGPPRANHHHLHPSQAHVRMHSNVRGTGSTEQILPDDTGAPPRMGGIQVERTVMVKEETSRRGDIDLEKGVYDWNTSGGSEHQTKVSHR